MRRIITTAIMLVSGACAHALSGEQDSRLAALVQYYQSMENHQCLELPAWGDIPSSERPVYGVQHMVRRLLTSCAARGKTYLSLPDSEKPKYQNKIYRYLYYSCASLARIDTVMSEFSPDIDEQTRKDISHIHALLLPVMSLYRPDNLDDFCDKASKLLTPKQGAELLVSILKQ